MVHRLQDGHRQQRDDPISPPFHGGFQLDRIALAAFGHQQIRAWHLRLRRHQPPVIGKRANQRLLMRLFRISPLWIEI